MRYKEIIDNLKTVDVNLINNWDVSTKSEVIEKQKIFFWVRLYLRDENTGLKIGDEIIIRYSLSGEELNTKFVYYDKNVLNLDHKDEIINYVGDDNKKVLCLLVDESEVNNNSNIPFIRKLFKSGIHYEYQLIRRDELIFINKRTEEILDYYDCDF